MKKHFGEYQRLARGAFGCSSLWAGEDHLLYVRGSGFLIPFSEQYLRFRYQDIQALVLVGTSGRLLSGVLYGVGLLLSVGLCALILGLGDSGQIGPLLATLVLPFPLAMVFLVLLVRTLLLGQRCVCEVQTSLKKEKLRMLTRLHHARRVVDAVDEKIQLAQQELLVDDTRLSGLPGTPGGPDAGQGGQLTVPGSALPTFAAASILAVLMLLQLHQANVALAWASQIMGMVLAPLVLFAIASSVRCLTSDGIRFALWGLLAALLATGGGALIFILKTAVEDPAVTVSLVSYFEAFAIVSSESDLGFYLYFLILAVSMLCLGIIGLSLALRWREAKEG